MVLGVFSWRELIHRLRKHIASQTVHAKGHRRRVPPGPCWRQTAGACGPAFSQISIFLPAAYSLEFMLDLQFQVRIFKLFKMKCVHASTLQKGQKEAGTAAPSSTGPALLASLPVGAQEMQRVQPQPRFLWHFLTISPLSFFRIKLITTTAHHFKALQMFKSCNECYLFNSLNYNCLFAHLDMRLNAELLKGTVRVPSGTFVSVSLKPA